MAERTRVYALDQVKVSFLGIDIGQGYGDGDAIKITPEGPAFDKKKGKDGSVTRFKTGNDKIYTVEIVLGYRSSVNKTLHAIHKADVKTPNGAGVGILTIADLGGNTLFNSGAAWITQVPERVLSDEPGDRTWPFQATECDDQEA